jgi:hypothetical protein
MDGFVVGIGYWSLQVEVFNEYDYVWRQNHVNIYLNTVQIGMMPVPVAARSKA